MSETPSSDTAAKLPAKEPDTDCTPARIARDYKEPKSVDRMPDREGNSMTGKTI